MAGAAINPTIDAHVTTSSGPSQSSTAAGTGAPADVTPSARSDALRTIDRPSPLDERGHVDQTFLDERRSERQGGDTTTDAGSSTPAVDIESRDFITQLKIEAGQLTVVRQSVLAAGVSEGEYVEIVGLVAMVMMMDTFRRAMDLPLEDHRAPWLDMRHAPADVLSDETVMAVYLGEQNGSQGQVVKEEQR